MADEPQQPEQKSWEFIRMDFEHLARSKERAGFKDLASLIRRFAADLPKKKPE